MNSQEQELISIIRDAKDPVKALEVAVEIMVKMLEDEAYMRGKQFQNDC